MEKAEQSLLFLTTAGVGCQIGDREWYSLCVLTLAMLASGDLWVRLGNGCALLLVCWLGGQLWYNGSRVLETRGSSISLGMFCKVLCCGMAALLVKPDYGPVVEAREDREEPRDQEMNLINMGVAWTSKNPDT